MIALINAYIVTENAVLKGYALLISNSRIYAIINQRELFLYKIDKIYDFEGQYILPGFIDIHSDIIESIIVPRKGLIFDYKVALTEIDKQLVNQGITTIFHSISVANSTICGRNRTLSVEQMLEIGKVINENSSDKLIHHKFHIRLEVNTIEAVDEILHMIRRRKVDELSIMDHTPGQGQYRDLKVYKQEIIKQYGNISEESQNEIIKQCKQKEKISDSVLTELLELAKDYQIPLAYHDVDSIDTLEWLKSKGISICEFPICKSVAKKAVEMGLFSVVGAPNVLQRSSHNNNLSAIEAIKSKVANIICSDYYSISMLYATFHLHFIEKIPLNEAVALATINPAKAVKIDKQYGSIQDGKIADLIIVKVINGTPKLTHTIIEGKLVSMLSYSKENHKWTSTKSWKR